MLQPDSRQRGVQSGRNSLTRLQPPLKTNGSYAPTRSLWWGRRAVRVQKVSISKSGAGEISRRCWVWPPASLAILGGCEQVNEAFLILGWPQARLAK
jgi:hypothetical protein